MRCSTINPSNRHTFVRPKTILLLFITGLLCTASAQADFATVAGTAQPNAIGHLLITFTGAEGKPEAKEFSVYFSGPDPKVTDTVFIGRTGLSADLVAGTYDIKVPVHPILWMRNVVIEEGKTTNMDVGGYGRIRINAEDSSGQPLEYDFKVWTRDDKKDLVIQGSTNIPSEYVLAGTYNIEVEPEGWMPGEPMP
jgi:hypothetical protein